MTGLDHFSFPRVWDALGFVLRVVLGEDESYARVPSSFVFFLSRLRIWRVLASFKSFSCFLLAQHGWYGLRMCLTCKSR